MYKRQVYDREGSVDVIGLAKNRLFFAGMQDMRLQELYVCDIHGENRRQLTGFNEEFFADVYKRQMFPFCVTMRQTS